MKKCDYLILLGALLLASCAGNNNTTRSSKPAPPVATTTKPAPSLPAPSIPPKEPLPNSAPTPKKTAEPEPIGDAAVGDNSKKPGGYYLDDGPDDNPPANIDNIPNATPKKEPLLTRANKPYKALGVVYTPMTSGQNYKARGLASWYGKRFHGKKTSSGEVYNMYGMSAAHTTLPLPSYAKVTNPANGRSVIVRINDRGPFKSTRIIDLSYAAAYKLRLISKGSGMVEVETIHANQLASNDDGAAANTSTATASSNEVASAKPISTPVVTPTADQSQAPTATPAKAPTPDVSAVAKDDTSANTIATQYFIQAGAFKSEANAEALMKKIQSLEIEQNTGFNRVYNNGLHRLKIGPYVTKQEADLVAASIRKQLNTSAIILNQ